LWEKTNELVIMTSSIRRGSSSYVLLHNTVIVTAFHHCIRTSDAPIV